MVKNATNPTASKTKAPKEKGDKKARRKSRHETFSIYIYKVLKQGQSIR